MASHTSTTCKLPDLELEPLVKVCAQPALIDVVWVDQALLELAVEEINDLRAALAESQARERYLLSLIPAKKAA